MIKALSGGLFFIVTNYFLILRIWYIVFVPSNSFVLYRSDGSLSLAMCDDDTKTIYISNQIKGNFLRKVFCHVNLTVDQEELLADLVATYGYEIIYITNEIFRKLKWESYY